jgi:hypothetical protein
MTAIVSPATPPPTTTGPDVPDGGDKQSKYTVMLTPRSVASLKEAARINHESRTNVLNRGVQLYLLITRLINNGWEIVARDQEGREQQIQIL